MLALSKRNPSGVMTGILAGWHDKWQQSNGCDDVMMQRVSQRVGRRCEQVSGWSRLSEHVSELSE